MTTPLPAGWKPIESAPKDGTPVLLFARHVDATASTRVVGSFDNNGFGWIAQCYVGQPFARLVPSHWMELPAFPDTPPATAQDAPITVSLDPDPRGVSVGVWQGSRCIYNGSHAVPSAQDDAKDERQAFEAWAKKKKMPLARVGEQYDDFWVDHAWNGWQARAALDAPAAGDAQDDQTRWTLRWIMREADAAKETCSTDPESPAAIRNAKLAAIGAAAAQALGLVRGPSYADPGAGDAQDAARWLWIFSHAKNVGFDYQSGRFTTLTIAGRQRESLVAFVDAAIAASQQQEG